MNEAFINRSASFGAVAALLLVATGGAALAQKPAAVRNRFGHRIAVKSGAGGPAAATTTGRFTYYGGRIVSDPVYHNILWASGNVNTYSGDIELFLRDMGVLAAQMMSEYATAGLPAPTSNQTIAEGAFGATYSVTPATMAATVDNSDITTQLIAWMAAGKIPRPVKGSDGANRTIYNVMFPAGTRVTFGPYTSCAAGGFCAYHHAVKHPVYGEFYYIVMPSNEAGSGCDTGCGGGTSEDRFTSALSHEILETITDPEIPLATSLAPPVGWYDINDYEIADVCNQQQAPVKGPSGRTWTVQQWFSNAQNACVSTVPGTQSIVFSSLTNQSLATGPVIAQAAASSGLPVSFSGGTTNVCSVSNTGVVSLTGTGSCSVTARQAGGQVGAVLYAAAAPVTRTFSVLLPQTINLPPVGPQKFGGAPVTVTPAATSGLPVTLTTLSPAICSVLGNIVTLSAGGECRLQATQPGDASYAPAPAVTGAFQIAGPPATAYQIQYLANLPAGDSTVNLVNNGAVSGDDPAGRICANVYVYDPNEEPIACCSCLLTPNSVRSLSARGDLVSNTLTSSVPSSLVVNVVYTQATGTCDAGTSVNAANLAPGGNSWATTLHANTSISPLLYDTTETRFADVPLSISQLNKLVNTCSYIEAYASKFGLCKSCQATALGGSTKK